MSFGIFLLRQHVSSAIPTELLEAGRVDGASEWWILARVIAPLSVPAMSAIGIFAFIQAWARLHLAADGRQRSGACSTWSWA